MDTEATIRNWAEKEKYDLWNVGNPQNLILVGEIHSHNHEDPLKKKQRELVELLRPEYLLDEYHATHLFFNPEKKTWRVHPGVEVNGHEQRELAEMIKRAKFLQPLGEKYTLPIVGIDLSRTESDRIFDEMPEDIKWSKEGLYFMVARNTRMAQRCVEYAGKTSRPVIAQMGVRHMDQESTIHQDLQGKVSGYWCINQNGKK